MAEKVVTVKQIQDAKKFREAFLKTTDGSERVPTLSEFVDYMVISDRRREQELAEYRKQQRAEHRKQKRATSK
jgi:hypothetical protein